MLLFGATGVVTPSFATEVVVLGVEADLAHEIEESRSLLESGSWREGLLRLQKAQGEAWGRGHLVAEKRRARMTGRRVFVGATGYAVELLQDLAAGRVKGVEGPAFLAQYRELFDAPATALFERSLAAADADALQRCYEVYPLATVATRAALSAGDLYFESNQIARARELWSRIDWDSLQGQPELAREVSLRWVYLTARLQDKEGYSLWRARWDEVAENRGPEVPSAPRAMAAKDSDRLPALPFRTGDLHWVTYGSFTGSSFFAGRQPHYTRQVAVFGPWFAVTLGRELRCYELSGGKESQNATFPRTRKKGSEESMHFKESDPTLRLRPAERDGILVSSYVVRATEYDQYMGYVIQESIPQRGLLVCKSAAPSRRLWSTEDVKDDLVSSLSFNQTPVIRDGRLYAMGWRQAGFIDSYLVCFRLRDGEVLWKTPLVGNQIDLTMFGEMNSEPLLGDLVVSDDAVFACTNLGAVAAVRPWNGELIWVTPYPAMEIAPPRQQVGTRVRPRVWAYSPLALFDQHVVAVPLDSRAALSIHRQSGELIATETSFSGRARQNRYLVGRFGDRAVFTVGKKLYTMPSDLSRFETHDLLADVRGMPALVREGLVYSGGSGLYFHPLVGQAPNRGQICKLTHKRPKPSRGKGVVYDGNVTVTEDLILVANSYHVSCYKELPKPILKSEGNR